MYVDEPTLQRRQECFVSVPFSVLSYCGFVFCEWLHMVCCCFLLISAGHPTASVVLPGCCALPSGTRLAEFNDQCNTGLIDPCIFKGKVENLLYM